MLNDGGKEVVDAAEKILGVGGRGVSPILSSGLAFFALRGGDVDASELGANDGGSFVMASAGVGEELVVNRPDEGSSTRVGAESGIEGRTNGF